MNNKHIHKITRYSLVHAAYLHKVKRFQEYFEKKMENGDSKDHYFYTSKLEKLKQVSLSSITYLDSRELIFMEVLHGNVLLKHACFTQKLETCFPIGRK